MRKSCVYVVHSREAACGRVHDSCASDAQPCELSAVHGHYSASFPRLLRTQATLFYTAIIRPFLSVNSSLFPIIHTTNNNYNFVYISI